MCDELDTFGICKFSISKNSKCTKNQMGWCEDVRYVPWKKRRTEITTSHETAIWGPIVSSLNHFWQQILVKYGPSSFFRKIAVDHVFWKIPILFVFFAYTEIYKGKRIREALGKAWNLSASSVQLTSLKVWPAVQTINFYLVPLNLRVLYMNVSLVFWTIFLAIFMRKKSKQQHQQQQRKKCDWWF